MKILHFCVAITMAAMLSGWQWRAITDRQPDTGRLCQSIHREYQPSAGSHVSYHSIAKQYAFVSIRNVLIIPPNC